MPTPTSYVSRIANWRSSPEEAHQSIFGVRPSSLVLRLGCQVELSLDPHKTSVISSPTAALGQSQVGRHRNVSLSTLRRHPSSNAYSPQAEDMADAGADSLRLSPVFDRPRDNPLNKMEGLNPERAMRLLQSRSPERSPSPGITIGPRITGSNAVGLGVATTRQLTGVKRERSPSRDGEARSLAQVPRTASQSLPLVIAGVKRRRSHLDEPEPRSTRQWCSVPPVLPPRESVVNMP